MAPAPRIITLLTDFGLQDHFVAAMKGVMLGINPELHFIDISHLVPPHDVQSAAFILGQAVPCFPPDTIHLAVVDPGVGTARKALAVLIGGQYFVAPDNGILSHVLAGEGTITAHEVTSDHYFRKPVSSTFHGRDIFAPIAAYISRDIPLPKFGPILDKPVRLKLPGLTRVRDTLIQATILAVDRFGNLVTNLKPEDLPVYTTPGGRVCKILASQREIASFRKTFGEGAPREIFVVPGSAGYLEIVMREGSAAEELKLKPGALIGVVLG
jgi:S-adenosylmethionine hydrolase